MDKKYFTTYQINDHIYQLKDPMGVLTTLIIGKTKALLIDTAYGLGDLKSELEELTKLPLIVINSHGHMDHSGGNYQFNEVWIDERDYELCGKHNNEKKRNDNIETAQKLNILTSSFDIPSYLGKRAGNLKKLNFETLDLGDLTIKIVDLKGHTQGSIGFLIEEDRLLVTSDAICPWVWLFLEESTSVKEYLETLKFALELPFDGFLLGHGAGQIMPKDVINNYLKTTKEIDLSKSVKVSYNHFEHLDSYCYSEYAPYEAGKWGIMFSPDKL
ncbi:MAG: MBL fold metallo-hydrolase [Bacilli bacterium]|nr:MBL fold metallo-hydrolase [Bacilli bacterium]